MNRVFRAVSLGFIRCTTCSARPVEQSVPPADVLSDRLKTPTTPREERIREQLGKPTGPAPRIPVAAPAPAPPSLTFKRRK